jgi:hypothetical protein
MQKRGECKNLWHVVSICCLCRTQGMVLLNVDVLVINCNWAEYEICSYFSTAHCRDLCSSAISRSVRVVIFYRRLGTTYRSHHQQWRHLLDPWTSHIRLSDNIGPVSNSISPETIMAIWRWCWRHTSRCYVSVIDHTNTGGWCLYDHHKSPTTSLEGWCLYYAAKNLCWSPHWLSHCDGEGGSSEWTCCTRGMRVRCFAQFLQKSEM